MDIVEKQKNIVKFLLSIFFIFLTVVAFIKDKDLGLLLLYGNLLYIFAGGWDPWRKIFLKKREKALE